jgi:DNA-binding NarL/FixJ family response regulator
MAKKTTIVLIDDHAVVRAGVRRLLEQESLFELIVERRLTKCLEN